MEHRPLWWTEETKEGRRKVTVTFASPLPGVYNGTYKAHYYPDDAADYMDGKHGYPQRQNMNRNTLLMQKCKIKGGASGAKAYLGKHPEHGPGDSYPQPPKPPEALDLPAPTPQVHAASARRSNQSATCGYTAATTPECTNGTVHTWPRNPRAPLISSASLLDESAAGALGTESAAVIVETATPAARLKVIRAPPAPCT